MEIVSCEKQESFVASGLDLFYNSLPPPPKNPRKENAISGEERDKGLFGIKKDKSQLQICQKIDRIQPV